MMTTLELAPRDLLFLRDGRPMDVDPREGSYRNVGHGASWPRPDHLYNALMHAVIGRKAGEKEYGRHGDLRTAGPFPMKAGEVYFPRPLDWKMTPVALGETDLSETAPYLEYGFQDCDQTKKAYPVWITHQEYVAYLNGKCGDFAEGDKRELYVTERRSGNTLDDARNASAKSSGNVGARYTAEYLRLASGVTMWAAACMGKDDLAIPDKLIMGGQGGVVNVLATNPKTLSELFPMPKATGDGKVFVRWTLLTPAYYPETGWLPSFCVDTRKDAAEKAAIGTVMLKDAVGSRLVGACTGKPIVFSGYDTVEGIKPTVLAVPAGSAYLFECADATAANALIDKLHLVSRSQNNNAGFGIGVCSLVSVG